MSSLLIYILKSTICLSLLYLLYRTMMRKETSFTINRIILLSIVFFSTIIPLLTLPAGMQLPLSKKISPVLDKIANGPQPFQIQQPDESINTPLTRKSTPAELKANRNFSIQELVQYTYVIGLSISLLLLFVGLISILTIFRKAKWIKMEGYKVLLVDRDISAFSFSRYVILSKTDYEEHKITLLVHEQAHIKLFHFYDLALLGLAKIVHWFNPFIYLLINDLKEIHEFQADVYTLTKGIDATQYQLLIIKKGVGSQRFALANSFNYCQIKKRIAMINNQKTRKAWNWKVATFLPLLALLLMAFGRQVENVPPNQSISSMVVSTYLTDSVKQWTEADFSKPDKLLKEFPKTAILAVNIQINSRSEIRGMHENSSLNELADYVRIFKDYDFSTEKTKPGFRKIVINGQEKMRPITILRITKDINTLPAEYQKMLNVIGNTILEIREKYSKEIFNTPYSKLTSAQRDEIIMLVPDETVFSKTPIIASDVQKNPSPPPVSAFLPKDLDKSTLFVLDGKVIEKSKMEAIKLSEIGTVKVIKDKSATDLYGEKAINGVVLITTKNTGTGGNSTAGVIGNSDPQKNKDGIYIVAEQMPQFPGGDALLRKFVDEKIQYPEDAKKDKIEGRVFVTFVVNSKGKVVNAKIARGVCPSLNAEAIRVVSMLPDWTPGRENNEAVDVMYTIPVQFSLQTKAISSSTVN